jgi:hypothetical protein
VSILPQRATLRFSIMGLSTRDEVLFKSMVRLLSHRLRYAWAYDEGQPDLAVIGDAPPRTPCTYVLHVGTHATQQPHHVALPLHANTLEAALNDAGDAILTLKTPATPQQAAATSSLRAGTTMQLVRWPPASLLSGQPVRLRLATLMTGRPITLAQLHERSGVELASCERFCADAQAAGILRTAAAASAAPTAPRPAPAHPRGLLAQIRAKLGLGTHAHD